MITQGRAPSNLVPIQATAENIKVFRDAMGFYLQTVRQNINRFEYNVGRIAKNPDAGIVDTVLGGNEVIANMRADMSNFEDRWNKFNNLLQPAPDTVT
jgi:hypothetical protein